MHPMRRWLAAGAVVALAALAGCSRDQTARDVAAQNTSNIQRLANLYSAYQTYNGGRGPASEAEFKTFIARYDGDKLKMMGVKADDLGGLFTSERDGKPFKVRYKVGGGRGAAAPVVFEQDGKDGKRQVAFTGNAKVEDVDAATYDQMWAGKTGTAPPAGPRRRQRGRPPDRPAAGGPDGAADAVTSFLLDEIEEKAGSGRRRLPSAGGPTCPVTGSCSSTQGPPPKAMTARPV